MKLYIVAKDKDEVVAMIQGEFNGEWIPMDLHDVFKMENFDPIAFCEVLLTKDNQTQVRWRPPSFS